MLSPYEIDLLERPSDAELEQLERQIQRDLSLRIHDFRLQACNDGLILRGRIKTYYGKQLVQHAVMDVTDFPILANNIAVG